jgi:hypothetical protein
MPLFLIAIPHSNELRLYFQPDYDDIEEENRLKPFPSSRGTDKAKDSKKYGTYLIFSALIINVIIF